MSSLETHIDVPTHTHTHTHTHAYKDIHIHVNFFKLKFHMAKTIRFGRVG